MFVENSALGLPEQQLPEFEPETQNTPSPESIPLPDAPEPSKPQKFILLRADGWSFARIAQELDVSKTTLIKWSRKYQFEIQNQRAIRFEQLQEQWLAPTDHRINALGGQLQKIEAELARRDLAALSTSQLFALADRLRRQIKKETGPMTFTTPVTDIPDRDLIEQVHDWKP